MQSACHRVGPPQRTTLSFCGYMPYVWSGDINNQPDLLSAQKQPHLEGEHYFQVDTDEIWLDPRSCVVSLVFLTLQPSTPNPGQCHWALGNFKKGATCSFLACGPMPEPNYFPWWTKLDLCSCRPYPGPTLTCSSASQPPQSSACPHCYQHQCFCDPRENPGASPPKRPPS